MFGKDYWDGVTIPGWQVAVLLLVTFAVIAAVIVIICIVRKKQGERYSLETKDITYGAICIAASFALSYVKFFSLPAGGSITAASVLPMLIYCYYFGFRKSLVTASVYMVLQFIQGPYIVSPFSALFDYVFPYLALSLVGLFRFDRKKYESAIAAGKKPITLHSGFFIGTAVYFVVRYFSHILAGVLYWADISYMENGFLMWSGNLSGTAAAWGYSATYNLLFLLPDTLIAVAAGVALLASKNFNNFMAKSVSSKSGDANADVSEPVSD